MHPSPRWPDDRFRLGIALAALWLSAAMGTSAVAAVPSCVWKVYDAARGEPQAIFTDPDATPPFAMRLDGGFRTGGGTLSENGGIDFDGDGRTDPFRLTNRASGGLQWQYVSGGLPAGWQELTYAFDTLNSLQFGDFDADGKSDVFATHFAFPNQQWVYSSGGTGAYLDLAFASTSVFIGLGRFDGDLKTDVFGAVPVPMTSMLYDFDYSSGGAASFVNLSHNNFVDFFNSPAFPLVFGDFDGDGLTDVFEALDGGNGTAFWLYFPDGASPSKSLGSQPFLLRDLQLADFDADGKTDIFTTRALPDGRLEWIYFAGGTGDPIVLNTVDGPVPLLGDFTGDGRTDAMVIECGTEPVVTPLPEFDVTKVPKSIFRHSVGDVNGDGHPDVIRSSVCQNYNPDPGICGSAVNLIQTVLGDGHGGFSTTTPLQTLFSGTNFSDANSYEGDFTGDGLTDLAWLVSNGTSTDIYVAAAVGDGSFREIPKQTLTVPSGLTPAVIDLNHDGRADFLWTSVCQERKGFDFTGCAVGDNNQAIAAIAGLGGVFTLSSLQSLSPSGWTNFAALAGDVNGDGNVDLVFNSTCQKKNSLDNTCTLGAANIVSVALGDGHGGFTLGPPQTYETSGWDSFSFKGLVDLDGDGREDLVWIDRCDAFPCAGGSSLVVRAGLAKPDGTFTVTPAADLGSGYWASFQLERGDVDGDGKADLILYALGQSQQDSGVVYVFFGDGAGGFTASPMQLLHGRGWNGVGFRAVSVGDLTGDGKAELTWFDTSPADHDRIIVSGNVAAITATTSPPTTTTAPTPTTTTTTTLPDCAAQSGLTGAQCFCASALAPASCGGAPLPSRLTSGFGKVCSLLDRATTATPKTRKKLLGKVIGRLGGLVRTASKRAITKKLPAGCGTALRSQLSALRTDAREARKSSGR
jgi:hypothetical protein